MLYTWNLHNTVYQLCLKKKNIFNKKRDANTGDIYTGFLFMIFF